MTWQASVLIQKFLSTLSLDGDGPAVAMGPGRSAGLRCDKWPRVSSPSLISQTVTPDTSQESPGSVISNWQRGDILIRRLHRQPAEAALWKNRG